MMLLNKNNEKINEKYNISQVEIDKHKAYVTKYIDNYWHVDSKEKISVKSFIANINLLMAKLPPDAKDIIFYRNYYSGNFCGCEEEYELKLKYKVKESDNVIFTRIVNEKKAEEKKYKEFLKLQKKYGKASGD